MAETASAGLVKERPTPCEICTLVVDEIKIGVQIANSTIEEMEKMIRQDVCAMLPDESQKELCNKIVDDIKVIVDMIMDHADVSEICKKLGLCKTSTLKDKLSRLPQPPIKTEACDICTLVVNWVNIVLKETNATVEEITELISTMCEMNPSYKDQCEAILKKVDEVVEYILEGLEPGDICKKLGYCPSSLQRKPVIKQYSPCKTCTLVVSLVDAVLKHVNATAAEVEKMVKSICAHFPESEPECSKIADEVQTVIELILKGLSPDGICQKLGFCPKALARDTNNDCPTCGLLVQVVQMGVASHIPRENMKSAINFVCGLYKKHHEFVQCVKFADNLDKVIDMLASGKSPGQICEVLGKCTANDVSKMVIRFRKQQSNNTCEICKTIVAAIANAMKEGEANLKVLEEGVMEICSMLGEQEAECKKITGEVFDGITAVLDMIIAEADPEAICKDIAHVCP